MDKIIVTVGGGALIAFIYWFFFGKREGVVKVEGKVQILVSGGYKPENIEIKKGKETKLVFERTDPSSCLEEVVIPDFKIRRYLPSGKKTEIKITPEREGVFEIHCGMNMFHGKIVVK